MTSGMIVVLQLKHLRCITEII